MTNEQLRNIREAQRRLTQIRINIEKLKLIGIKVTGTLEMNADMLIQEIKHSEDESR